LIQKHHLHPDRPASVKTPPADVDEDRRKRANGSAQQSAKWRMRWNGGDLPANNNNAPGPTHPRWDRWSLTWRQPLPGDLRATKPAAQLTRILISGPVRNMHTLIFPTVLLITSATGSECSAHLVGRYLADGRQGPLSP
jgi:hypothetical protein